jgi:hypothetical protein
MGRNVGGQCKNSRQFDLNRTTQAAERRHRCCCYCSVRDVRRATKQQTPNSNEADSLPTSQFSQSILSVASCVLHAQRLTRVDNGNTFSLCDAGYKLTRLGYMQFEQHSFALRIVECGFHKNARISDVLRLTKTCHSAIWHWPGGNVFIDKLKEWCMPLEQLCGCGRPSHSLSHFTDGPF